MLRRWISLIGLLPPCIAIAQPAAPGPHTVSLHATYETYAAGLHVAEVEAGVRLSPLTYTLNLAYHTTGMLGLFLNGQQASSADGFWIGPRAEPTRFLAEGSWRGDKRLIDVIYRDGKPIVRQLVPPNDAEREPVPEALQMHTIDTLSALAELIRVVDTTGRCDTQARTYDGRRAVDIEAHTVGQEVLEPTSRSSFAGTALHCSFVGTLTAGFMLDGGRQRDARPMRGSAWLAPATAGGAPIPVRMVFETRWTGDATMYLTAIRPLPAVQVAGAPEQDPSSRNRRNAE